MTKRKQLGWRVPRTEWDQFVAYVEEKWGELGPYLRFEMEKAMREFLDQDEKLAKAEALLRKHLDSMGLSSSSTTVPSDIDHSDTVKLGQRINADLKTEFAGFSDEHYQDSYGAVLARALNAYRKGGRARRLLEGIKQLCTGRSTTGSKSESDESVSQGREESGTNMPSDESQLGSVESPGLSSFTTAGTTSDTDDGPEVDQKIVMDIAEGLNDQFSESTLATAIAKTVSGDVEVIQSYTEAIVDFKNCVKHPYGPVYIPKEERERRTLWCDLNRETRAVRLRRLIVKSALEVGEEKHACTYREVQELFEDDLGKGPSHDYAYTLMEDAGKGDAFMYGEYQGQKQLRVDIRKVSQSIIREVAENYSVSTEGITVNGEVTAYNSGGTPQQEGAADD